MKNDHVIVGWIAVIGFKLAEYWYGADWIRWSDAELFVVLAFTGVHLVAGFVANRRKEDRRRARFL